MPWHTCSERYDVGEKISPGRWGRTVLTVGPGHPAWEREQLLERVRTEVASEAPSRLTAAFAHAHLADASGYAEPTEHVYAVELTAVAVTRDMLWNTWIREQLEAGDRVKAERQAEYYWRGESSRDHLPAAMPHWEVITGGALVVGVLAMRSTLGRGS